MQCCHDQYMIQSLFWPQFYRPVKMAHSQSRVWHCEAKITHLIANGAQYKLLESHHRKPWIQQVAHYYLMCAIDVLMMGGGLKGVDGYLICQVRWNGKWQAMPHQWFIHCLHRKEQHQSITANYCEILHGEVWLHIVLLFACGNRMQCRWSRSVGCTPGGWHWF